MDDALDAGFGQLCVSAGWRLSGVAFGSGLMCEWWLAHCGVGGVLVRWRGRGMAVFRGCCVLGVLVNLQCASGGWHIVGRCGVCGALGTGIGGYV